MKDIGHKAILASAGSGKTFQLAHRYIRLLASGVGPDRICAMTFTRKAAGEILDSIAGYLRESASDAAAARVTASERIGAPDKNRDDFLHLLRVFIDGLHRTRVGTLDSFIVGIAKAFPVELGIPMGFQVVDNDSARARENRRMVLERLLGPMGSGEVGRNFINAFKVATYGSEEKTLGTVLDTFLDSLKAQYRLCPDGKKWGNEDLMWPGKGRPFRMDRKFDRHAAADAVESWALVEGGKFHITVAGIAQALRNYGPDSAWEDAFGGTVFDRLIESFDDLDKGDVEITYSRKDYNVPKEIATHLHGLLYNLFAIEYDRMLRRTTGMFSLVSMYEQAYEEITRAVGSFSFTDIQYFLTGPDSIGGGKLISREPGTQIERLYIDYRMDCRLDHWLLDEFQDTSDLQWAVFDNLVSELLSAPASDNRSFFYVGDVKQAIYRWRGGNHELFFDILKKYNAKGEVIELEPLQKTRRCALPVIDTVNRVFGKLPDDLPCDAVKRWSDIWTEHETAVEDGERGHAALIEPGDTVPANQSEESRCVMTADLLNELKPVQRGLEAGILVRSNDFGRKLVNALRELCPDMSFVHEGEATITDNEVAQTLLALVKLAAHPGDEYAWRYVQMTPLAGVLAGLGIGRGNIAPTLLAELQENGFQEFIGNWGEQLTFALKVLHNYGKYCLERLEKAAAEYDGTGAGDCNGFLDFMDSYTLRDQPSGSAVRVMTIHQSKGLEFDIVILPQLQGGGIDAMDKASRLDLICAGGRSDPEWIIKMPKKMIAEQDDVLNEQISVADAEHCYDSLCTLYVAMTRAKRGLYMLSTTSKSASTFDPARFLKQQLSGGATENIELNGSGYKCLHEVGDRSVFAKELRRDKGVKESIKIVKLPKQYAKNAVVLKRREPSKQGDIERSAASLFEARSADIMNFGLAIHEMFEKVEWADDADADAIIKEWEPTPRYDAEVTRDAIEQFRACMKSETIRKHLSKPSASSAPLREVSPILWLEKRFEVVLKGEFVSGAFDRVVITRDDAGKPVSAAIYDYKSSIASSDAEIDKKVADYAPQMNIYRDALSVILGLDKKDISLNLIFTRQQVVRTL